MNYLILAYKRDNDDYCMGCHMASYSSNFQYLNTNDREKAIRFLVDKINFKGDDREAGYRFTIFIDGKTSDCNDLDGETTDYDNLTANPEGEYEYDEEPGRKLMADANDTADREANDAVEKAKAAAARQKAAEEAQKAIDKVRKAAEKEENDRKEFERLKAKFEGESNV